MQSPPIRTFRSDRNQCCRHGDRGDPPAILPVMPLACPPIAPALSPSQRLRHAGRQGWLLQLSRPRMAISAPGGNCVNITVGAPCLYPILTTSTLALPVRSLRSTRIASTRRWARLLRAAGSRHGGVDAVRAACADAIARNEVGAGSHRATVPDHQQRQRWRHGDSVHGSAIPAASSNPGRPIGMPLHHRYLWRRACSMPVLRYSVQATVRQRPASGAKACGGTRQANSESGWGINFAHQGECDLRDLVHLRLDKQGLVVVNDSKQDGYQPDIYTGQLFRNPRPRFQRGTISTIGEPRRRDRDGVGTATVSFSDVNRASFNYVVNGTQRTKSLTRQVFGRLPTCVYGAQPDFAAATNYQDLWWASPPGSESGWGRQPYAPRRHDLCHVVYL